MTVPPTNNIDVLTKGPESLFACFLASLEDPYHPNPPIFYRYSSHPPRVRRLLPMLLAAAAAVTRVFLFFFPCLPLFPCTSLALSEVQGCDRYHGLNMATGNVWFNSVSGSWIHSSNSEHVGLVPFYSPAAVAALTAKGSDSYNKKKAIACAESQSLT